MTSKKNTAHKKIISRIISHTMRGSIVCHDRRNKRNIEHEKHFVINSIKNGSQK